MSQTLTIGSVTLQPDAAWFHIDRVGILGQTNRITKTRNIWTIDGYVKSTSTGVSAATLQAEVDTRVLALESAVREGIDVTFSLGSSMHLRSVDCLEGTHIKSFSWLTGYDGVRGSGAEGLLRRTFRLIVYGDILATSDTDITQWQESLSFIGTGLKKTVPVGSLTGGVQAQQVQAYTPYYILQSGFAVGMTVYPSPPSPSFQGIAGYYYLPDSVSTTKTTPRNWGRNRDTNFGVRWSYKCWSALDAASATPQVF